MISRHTVDPHLNQVERICISVNTQCNYACKYCYFFNPDNHIVSECSLRTDEILQILSHAFDYHKKYNFEKKIKVNFVGSGEPLLNWQVIADAVSAFGKSNSGQTRLCFYTVTNASLLTPQIAEQMKYLQIFPSVSLDGPRELHNAHRIFHNGKGTFDVTMRGMEVLRNSGFEITINTTLNRVLLEHLDVYFDFIVEQKFNKVIFDRLVDAPYNVDVITYAEYYDFLETLRIIKKERKMDWLEIGNLDAYRRNFAGIPDQVCTMFGGSCGAGSHFLIYIGRDVYPCGRMFGQDKWYLGNYDQPIDTIQNQMAEKLPERLDCQSCVMSKECVRDCLMEYYTSDYSCNYRKQFLYKFGRLLTHGDI